MNGFAPLAAGLGLTLIEGGIALHQLWIFWVAPIAGAILAGIVYKIMGGSGEEIVGTDS